jgi:hypothetical protein
MSMSLADSAKALVVGPYPAHGTRGGVVAADFGNAAAKFGADGFDQVGFSLDDVRILHRKTNGAPGGVSAGLLAGASTPNDGEVDADGLEAFFLAAAESLAQADQQNDGG